MIDGIVKKAVEEQLKFVRVGDSATVDINTHEVHFVRLVGDRWLVACLNCRELVTDETAKPFLAAHNHTKIEESKPK